MHKNDGPDHDGNEFTDGDPGLGVPPSTVGAKILNTIQRELVAVVEAAGISLSDADDTQLLQAIPLTFGGRSGFRNLLHNGDFRYFQRHGPALYSGLVLTTREFVADRWRSRVGSSPAVATVERRTFTLDPAGMTGNPRYFLRHDQTTAVPIAGALAELSQPIEHVQTTAELPLILSWSQRDSTATPLITPVLRQFFGTGGSPSASVAINGTARECTSSWLRHSQLFTPASVGGKTLGTDGNDFLEVRFTFPVDETFQLDIADVQLEYGSVATPFERRPDAVELALCQRYYEKSVAPDIDPSDGNSEGRVYRWCIDTGNQLAYNMQSEFRTTKRITPAVTWWDASATPVQDAITWGTTSHVVTASHRAGRNSTGVPVLSVDPTGDNAGQGNWEAEADITDA